MVKPRLFLGLYRQKNSDIRTHRHSRTRSHHPIVRTLPASPLRSRTTLRLLRLKYESMNCATNGDHALGEGIVAGQDIEIHETFPPNWAAIDINTVVIA